jgi:2-polyprenyl-3-methyl-5-hydroxy-6-metoxy-1,4-benzoquinol methylase
MEALLEKFGIIKPENVYEYYPSVRDDENLSVYKDRFSGVVFLKKKTKSEDYYEKKNVSKNLNSLLIQKNGEGVLLPANGDDERRAHQFRSLIKGKAWLDFGCGTGRLIDLLKDVADSAHACELNSYYVQEMKNRGITVYKSFTEENYQTYDVITLFHVLEHIPNPIEVLALIFKLLKKGGTLVIEIPHANDFLLKSLDLESFKKFTFFSEHLVLHTRTSLEVLLRHTAFDSISIKGFQRYSLDNHLYWLRYSKPGGHNSYFRDILTDDLRKAYEGFLISVDQTDTLIAFAYK